jgi:hypothetical protein
MDEREAFEAYFVNQHRRKFPRRGTTGTQEREAHSAFSAGIAYAQMITEPTDSDSRALAEGGS